jgi:hypothetical protein
MRTRPTKPFPCLFRLSAEGSGEEPNKKIERKWFLAGGRPRHEGDDAVGLFLQSKSCGFCSYNVRTSFKKHRQFSLLPETAECGVSRSDTQCHFCATRQGFFSSHTSVRSAMWKFVVLVVNIYGSQLRTSFAFAKQPIFLFALSGDVKRFLISIVQKLTFQYKYE